MGYSSTNGSWWCSGESFRLCLLLSPKVAPDIGTWVEFVVVAGSRLQRLLNKEELLAWRASDVEGALSAEGSCEDQGSGKGLLKSYKLQGAEHEISSTSPARWCEGVRTLRPDL